MDTFGLYPFVSKIKIIDQIVADVPTLLKLESLHWCEPIIVNDFIYTVKTELNTAHTYTLTLLKLTRQDFHEHYYTVSAATTIDGPIFFTEDKDISNIKLQVDANNMIYLFYCTKNSYSLYIYAISILGYDLTFEYKINKIDNSTSYQFDMSYHMNSVVIGEFDESAQTLAVSTYTMGNITQVININLKCTLNLKMLNDKYCIIVRETDTNKIFISYLDPTGNNTLTFNTTLPAIQVSGNTGLSRPCMPQLVNFNDNIAALIYGFNNDNNDIFQLAFINTDIPAVNPPYYYKINKFDTFNEILDPDQTTMAVSVVSHPNNSNFFYVAYITSTNQIRLMKFYRNVLTGKETCMPVLLWATRLGVLGDPFIGQMSITISNDGYVYVILKNSTEIIIYKTNEFILDLGHAESTIVSPVDTISQLLTTMPSYYTIVSLSNSIHIPDLNYLNDVIVSSVVDDGKLIKITFKYIDYNVFQLYLNILAKIKTDIIDAFRLLYEDSSINVLNLNFTDLSIDGTDETIVAHFNTGTLKKPCVLKGTEIIVFKNGTEMLINVEKIQTGDIVINHEGSHARVLDHMISTIYAQSHNAPYFICKNFFGEDRPYKDLYISGDHGILLNYKDRRANVIYAQDIKILKQCFINKTVEFHHLLLEDHKNNFYLANGLEVDSYHPTIIMKR